MAIIFPFIINTENGYFMGIGIHGVDPPQNSRKLVHFAPHENEAIHSTL